MTTAKWVSFDQRVHKIMNIKCNIYVNILYDIIVLPVDITYKHFVRSLII